MGSHSKEEKEEELQKTRKREKEARIKRRSSLEVARQLWQAHLPLNPTKEDIDTVFWAVATWPTFARSSIWGDHMQLVREELSRQ